MRLEPAHTRDLEDVVAVGAADGKELLVLGRVDLTGLPQDLSLLRPSAAGVGEARFRTRFQAACAVTTFRFHGARPRVSHWKAPAGGA